MWREPSAGDQRERRRRLDVIYTGRLMVRRLSAALSSAVLVFLAEPRVAQAAPVLRIEWPTVPGCPAPPVVTQHARTAIARAKDVDDVLAIAEITPPTSDGGAWQLHMRTRTLRGAGERTLEGESCDALARAAGLLVALASLRTRPVATDQPLLELAPESDRVHEPDALVAPLSLPARPEHETDETERARTTPARFVSSVGIGFSAGLLPNVGVGPSVSLGYEASWLRARVGVRAALPQEETRWGLGAELSAFGASADICRRVPLGGLLPIKTHACAGVMVDDIRARGLGGTQTFVADRLAMLAFAGLTADWDIGRGYRVGADLRAGGSLMRPRFLVDTASAGERELHRPAALRAEGTVTFGLVF